MTNKNAVNVFISFSTMAAIFPTAASKSFEAMPIVTIDGFEPLAAGFRNVSKTSVISYAPLLRSASELEKWNAYAPNHSSWISHGRRDVDYGNLTVSDKFIPYVAAPDSNGIFKMQTGDGPFSPVWQISPVPINVQLINYDCYSFPATRVLFEHIVATQKASLSPPVPEVRTYYNIEAKGPISLLTQPVFNEVDNGQAREVVGFLTGYLAWLHIFENVLPDGLGGDIVVVIDSCGVKSTFLINGPEATFIGDGDLHNPKYEDMEVFDYFVGSDTKSSATSDNQCPHVVHVFPTSALENTFVTSTPMNYAFVIVAIFSFAALVFIAYDCFVTNRQSRTEQQADKSNAIVQDLFPGEMVTRLYNNTETGDATKGGLSLYKNGFGRVDRNIIADLHPEATVICKY
jgi:CHASE domain